MEREFNLIDEPWICVRMPDCSVQEVGLRELFANAHHIMDLAGETKTQDFAILRLLLAVVHTVFSRYGTNAEDITPSEDPDVLIDQWEETWKQGQFPMAPIERYLSEWHDRFWLFDEAYPFYQSRAVEGKSSPISTAKMIGTLFESNNKQRLFSERFMQGRELSFSEAARWLLHLNCFDDIAAKKPTPKKTWVGKLGLVALKGKNLFQTLMLNYVADQDIRHDVFLITPSWEEKEPPVQFNRLISVPHNQAALLSLQSRRIILCRASDKVTGYFLSGGDYFEDEELFDIETMTLWRGYQETKDGPYRFKPRRYDPAKMIWREFGSIAVENETNSPSSKQAGVIGWLNRLSEYEILSDQSFIRIETAAVIYDFKQATSLPVIDTISDTLTFHARLLEEIGADWRMLVMKEIEKCENAANQVFYLYKNLQKASGRRDKDLKTELSGEQDARAEFYAIIDRPFRLWLAGLDPTTQNRETAAAELEQTLCSIALRFGNELTAQAGNDAIFGRYVNGEAISSAQAIETYCYFIKRKIFTRAGEET